MNSNKISVIGSYQVTATLQRTEELSNKAKSLESKVIKDVLGVVLIMYSENVMDNVGVFLLGIMLFFAICVIPCTIIPRTDSIMYQSDWMEAMLPALTLMLLLSASRFITLITLIKEEALRNYFFFFKICFMDVIPIRCWVSYAIMNSITFHQ